MKKEHPIEKARRQFNEMLTGEKQPNPELVTGLRLKRVEYPKDDTSTLSAQDELKQMGYEVPEHIHIGTTGELGYFDMAFKPLVARGAANRIRMALIRMIRVKGFPATDDLINQSDLRHELVELVPDLFI